MYEKLNFENGQVLTAEALNHMENGIEKAGIGDAKITFDLSNKEAIKETFEKYNLARKAGSIISCCVKVSPSDPEYRPVLLGVEDCGVSGHRLTFVALGISASQGPYEGFFHPKAKLSDLTCDSYIIPQDGEVQPLGLGPLLIADEELNPDSTMPIANNALYTLLTKYAKTTEVPTKVSQLENDSDFVAKKDISTPDWNASTYKEGHIKNRTHHMQDYMCHYFKGSPIKVSKPSGTGYVLLAYDTDLADKFIRIAISEGKSKTHEFLDAMGMPLIFTWDAGNSTINVESFMGAVETYGMRAYYSSSAKSYDEYFVKLDKGFIPEGAMSQKSMVSITYKELVVLKERGQLTAGTYYRITDYITTVAQGNAQSAGHPFDVIVLALSENTLAEEAYAIQSARDTDDYFTNSNLAAWKLWYSLDNNAERFAWADTENGKGIIYRMIDEWNNDLPYDFKNIQYVDKIGFTYNQWGGTHDFVRSESLDKVIDGVQYYGYISNTKPTAWSEGKCWITDTEPSTTSSLYKEDGSAISYGGTIISVTTEEHTYYTFMESNDLNGECYGNAIKPYIKEGVQNLNKICFGNNCYSNSFGYNCYNNTFGDECYNNTFGDECYYNTFGNECYYNTFGNSCSTNTFGTNCFKNTFGNYCNENTFGHNCIFNSFGNDCGNNNFGNTCRYNDFSDNCGSNTFGDECSGNSFGNDCNLNTFGNTCNRNFFSSYCVENTFGHSFDYNTLGDGCKYNTFGGYCQKNTFGNSCSTNTFGENCTSNSFGDNCELNTFGENLSSNSFGNGCRENTFGKGCYSNSFGNSCYSNSFGNYCSSNTFGNECYNNSFGDSSLSNASRTYYRHNTFGEGVHDVTLKNDDTGTYPNQVQNYRVANGTNNQVVNVTRNNSTEYTIATNNAGELKVFSMADLA